MAEQDITGFLRARLAEDADTARAAIDHQSGRWEADPDEAAVYAVSDHAGFTAATDPDRCSEHPEGVPNECDHLRIADTEGVMDGLSPVQGPRAVHIARQDPQATLARVEALHLVLDAHEPHEVAGHRYAGFPAIVCLTCSDSDDGSPSNDVASPCPTLRALASVWRSHPDWNEQWAPDHAGAAS